MTAVELARLAGSPAGDPSPRAVLAAEWVKLRTSRGPRRNLALGAALGVTLTTLLALAAAASFDGWSTSQQAAFDPVLYPLAGSILVAIFFVAAGVGTVASEYSSGMTRLTFTITPQRRRVVAAKALAIAGATVLVGTAANVVMLGVGNLIYAAGDLPTADLADPGTWRTLGALVLLAPVFPVLGVFTAWLVRSGAAAIAIVLALIFAPEILGAMLPDWIRRNVLSLLPGSATDAVTIGHLSESPSYLHPVPALAVVVAWLAVAWLVARTVVERRDA